MNIQRKAKGFTIIEVVLVLAIAGLIFLMVFLALPSLQRSQRDSQRKGDMSRLHVAVTNYSTANRGSLPSTPALWTSLVSEYVVTGNNDAFIDPSGAVSTQGAVTTYVLTPSALPTLNTPFSNATQNVIYYTVGSVCGTTNDTVIAKGSRSVAFRMALENGGYDCRSI